MFDKKEQDMPDMDLPHIARPDKMVISTDMYGLTMNGTSQGVSVSSKS